MLKIPHLYRVEAGPLGPAKRPPPPSPADNPVVEPWRAVDGKPHLEQNARGQIRTKDFRVEGNNPYPSVPDKNTIEPLRPYFDPAVDEQLIEESDEYDTFGSGCWGTSIPEQVRQNLGVDTLSGMQLLMRESDRRRDVWNREVDYAVNHFGRDGVMKLTKEKADAARGKILALLRGDVGADPEPTTIKFRRSTPFRRINEGYPHDIGY